MRLIEMRLLVIARLPVIALTVASLSVPAAAQGMSHGTKHRAATQTTDQTKDKANDKDYKAALDRLPVPEKKYDPWGTARSTTGTH